MDGSLDQAISGLVNPYPDHSDQDGGNDGDEACNCHVTDFMQCPWQRQQQRNNHAYHCENNRTCPVVRQSVHHDGEGQDVAAHDEDQGEHLSRVEDFAPDSAKHDFSCVGHVVNVGISHLELSDHVAGICCKNTQTGDKDYSSVLHVNDIPW